MESSRGIYRTNITKPWKVTDLDLAENNTTQAQGLLNYGTSQGITVNAYRPDKFTDPFRIAKKGSIFLVDQHLDNEPGQKVRYVNGTDIIQYGIMTKLARAYEVLDIDPFREQLAPRAVVLFTSDAAAPYVGGKRENGVIYQLKSLSGADIFFAVKGTTRSGETRRAPEVTAIDVAQGIEQFYDKLAETILREGAENLASGLQLEGQEQTLEAQIARELGLTHLNAGWRQDLVRKRAGDSDNFEI